MEDSGKLLIEDGEPFNELLQRIADLEDALLLFAQSGNLVSYRDAYNQIFTTWSGQDLERTFDNTIHTLRAYDLITDTDNNLRLTKEGRKLFAELPPKEYRKPYTYFINNRIDENKAKRATFFQQRNWWKILIIVPVITFLLGLLTHYFTDRKKDNQEIPTVDTTKKK